MAAYMTFFGDDEPDIINIFSLNHSDIFLIQNLVYNPKPPKTYGY